ncbi:hypothetical protein BC829DRAFT_14294 [Chytridium lagenaria]|nr:hypothetical protein BC829DRAFT_14294 [Chytridium lagenaria]
MRLPKDSAESTRRDSREGTPARPGRDSKDDSLKETVPHRPQTSNEEHRYSKELHRDSKEISRDLQDGRGHLKEVAPQRTQPLRDLNECTADQPYQDSKAQRDTQDAASSHPPYKDSRGTGSAQHSYISFGDGGQADSTHGYLKHSSREPKETAPAHPPYRDARELTRDGAQTQANREPQRLLQPSIITEIPRIWHWLILHTGTHERRCLMFIRVETIAMGLKRIIHEVWFHHKIRKEVQWMCRLSFIHLEEPVGISST